MNQEHRNLIKELVSMPHFHALKAVLDERLIKLDSVSLIPEEHPNFSQVAMGKKLAAEMVKEMMTDLGLYEGTDENKRNTYE